jgi:hypothetical protein
MDDDYCLNKYMTSVIKIATSAKWKYCSRRTTQYLTLTTNTIN